MISIFDERVAVLGEGIFHDSVSNIIYWLDIKSDCIYYKSLDGYSGCFYLEKGSSPSAILDVNNLFLIYVDRFGLKKLFFDSCNVEILFMTPYPKPNANVRANDGVKLCNGSFLYGTMDSTLATKGCLYYYKNGVTSRILDSEIGIPNSFIPTGTSLLISDSYEKVIYEVKDFSKFTTKSIWADYTEDVCTPDGGCIDSNKYIYVAMWDGFRIAVFKQDGTEFESIKLPVPRPTNCTIVNDRWLYITTAKDGLTDFDVEKYPLSGKIFVVDLGVYFGKQNIS
jgi:sugar lactone lactonase YvrE